ncbi:hypothetical protein Nizo1839_2329 [Lactiplantibacillus plantarum]|nr:hypothetical protein Nizo1839_2329 [Lactiplantibacillus plantarum]
MGAYFTDETLVNQLKLRILSTDFHKLYALFDNAQKKIIRR